MKIALVSPATVVEFGSDQALESSVRQLAEHVPLGVLALVAVLREHSFDVDFIDANTVYYELLRQKSKLGIVDALAERIAAGRYDLVGFGTLSSSYPLVLRVADALERLGSSASILLGGPQASVVDRATLSDFPAVDFVLRGEADHTIVELMRALREGAALSSVPALSYRRGGDVVQNAPGPLPLELDRLPLPAYDAAPWLGANDTLPLEVGRGCPYGCTFCSTNNFFSRRFRMKSPGRVLEQLRALHARYGARRFDFVHDMLTVVRTDVVELCETLIEAGSPYEWYASARTDRVDDALFDLMRTAGCRGLFFGIETGSPKLQRSLKKRLDLRVAMTRVEQATERGLDVVVSLITGFPEEELEDLRYTVGLFVASLRMKLVSPQLHLLAPLAGTPLHATYRDRLVLDDVMSDMSHSGWTQSPEDLALISRHPDVFPNFYAVPTPLDRQQLKELRLFLLEAANTFRWLLVALHREVHVLDLFAEFRGWRRVPPEPRDLHAYYGGNDFRSDFLSFLRQKRAHGSAVQALLAISECANESALDPPRREPERDRPRRSPGVALSRISVDFAALMAALAEGSDLALVPPRDVAVVVRSSGSGVEMFELPSVAARVLELCDGEHSSRAIAEALADEAGGVGISGERLCDAALEALHSANLVKVHRSAAEFRSSRA